MQSACASIHDVLEASNDVLNKDDQKTLMSAIKVLKKAPLKVESLSNLRKREAKQARKANIANARMCIHCRTLFQ